jgi:hypothetical protein
VASVRRDFLGFYPVVHVDPSEIFGQKFSYEILSGPLGFAIGGEIGFYSPLFEATIAGTREYESPARGCLHAGDVMVMNRLDIDDQSQIMNLYP